MTCIVALKENNIIYMASERAASDDDLTIRISHPKIMKKGPYLIGFAGTMDGEKIFHNFNPSVPKDSSDIDKFMHSGFLKELRDFYDEWWVDTLKEDGLILLIGVNGKIYEHVASDMSMTELCLGYGSVGSGSQYAYGYLYATENKGNPESRVKDAVIAAIKFSPTCDGMVDFLSTE